MSGPCEIYKKKVIKRRGLKPLPKRKPSGTKDDIYRVLRFHWGRSIKAGVTFDTRVKEKDNAADIASNPTVRALGSSSSSVDQTSPTQGRKNRKKKLLVKGHLAVKKILSPEGKDISDVNMSDFSCDDPDDKRVIDSDTSDEDGADDEDDNDDDDSGYDSDSTRPSAIEISLRM
ncbi:hypothetical protein EMCG_01680 [[Emmonsia] crescens]|uniref:Uncharacterized protein n=1 Tax=[Emmonsia] crescens TaxID=73230 RepID=A0A0G2J2D6_9EURO|nr:hypothetical protein EMCG_01680 [Emmonsia crescens UAMH 3008]